MSVHVIIYEVIQYLEKLAEMDFGNEIGNDLNRVEKWNKVTSNSPVA